MRYKDYYKNSFEPHFYVNRILFYILTYSVSSLKYRMHSFISGTEFSPVVFVFNRKHL